jgi:hypothetical protein
MNSLFIMYKLDDDLQCNFYMTLNANLDYELKLSDGKTSFLICEGRSIFCWKKGRTSPIFSFLIIQEHSIFCYYKILFAHVVVIVLFAPFNFLYASISIVACFGFIFYMHCIFLYIRFLII